MRIEFRLARGARAVRLRAGRLGLLPTVDVLEGRQLLSGVADAFQPTASEQYMLELINRARANPTAEGFRLVGLAQTDPLLRSATQGWDLGKFFQTISAYAAEPPLAFNTRLIAAARNWNTAMLDANSQFHSPAGYLTNANVARASDGQAYYAPGVGRTATGENIFAFSQNVDASDPRAYGNYFVAAFLLDWGNPQFGHLQNILAPGPGSWAVGAPHAPYSEVGLGLLTGVTPTAPPGAGNSGLNVGPALTTQEFGFRTGNPFLTGTIYNDRDADGFYTPGEGVAGVTIRATGRSGQGVFTATTWGSGGYSLALPPGLYDVTAVGNFTGGFASTAVNLGVDNVGWSVASASVRADQPVPANYNGDSKTELGLFRSGTNQWFAEGQSAIREFGVSSVDIPLPGDYDGDGKAEPAVYRPSTAQWFALSPDGAGRALGAFGAPGTDVPLPADYDGIHRTEVAVYRPSTAQWFVLGPNGGKVLAQFGAPNTDVPMPADYDGVGRVEPAVYRPSTAQWFVLGPNGGRLLATFGQPNVDIPVPGDYDGDGKAEPAVYRPTTGQWFILGPDGPRVVNFGGPGVDVPVRGDFDGDGKADVAVYRPTTGEWFAIYSGGGVMVRQYGLGGTSTPVTSLLAQYASHPSPVVSASLIVPVPQAKEDEIIIPPAAPATRPRAQAVAVGGNALLRWARRGQSTSRPGRLTSWPA